LLGSLLQEIPQIMLESQRSDEDLLIKIILTR